MENKEITYVVISLKDKEELSQRGPQTGKRYSKKVKSPYLNKFYKTIIKQLKTSKK